MSKKKHLVVICGRYYPFPSPTALCAERYALLFKDEFDIDFISETENGDEENIRLSSGINVHTISCKRLSLELSSRGILQRILHAYGSLLLFSNLLGNKKWYRKAAFRKLEDINSQYPIDIIFSICSPLAAIWAGVDYRKKHPQVRLCSYTVDPYSTLDRIKPFFRSRRAMLDFECKALSLVNDCLLSEEVYDTREDIRNGLVRCSALPYLMPPFVTCESRHNQNAGNNSISHRLKCVYAGSFYDKIRNPEYMLKVFSQLSQETVELHLYSQGCDVTVAKYVNGTSIIEHGLVPPSKLQEIYKEADILIGIGNAVADFLPSKTFEYIAQRKPIVYFNHNSLKNEVLNDYPCALQVTDAEPIEEVIRKFLDFVSKRPSSLVDKNLLEKAYFKHSSKEIKKVLLKSFIKDEK